MRDAKWWCRRVEEESFPVRGINQDIEVFGVGPEETVLHPVATDVITTFLVIFEERSHDQPVAAERLVHRMVDQNWPPNFSMSAMHLS